MEPTTQPERTGRRHHGGPEPRVVAVVVRPARDAEARVRRIAAILLDHATRTGAQAGDENQRGGQ